MTLNWVLNTPWRRDRWGSARSARAEAVKNGGVGSEDWGITAGSLFGLSEGMPIDATLRLGLKKSSDLGDDSMELVAAPFPKGAMGICQPAAADMMEPFG